MRLSPFLRVLEGEGGRYQNNKLPQGLTMKSLKKHVALQPLFAIMGVGIAFVGFYCIRLATTSPDVSWTKKNEPYDTYRHRQYKFLNPSGLDYNKACQAPQYKD